MAQSQPPRHRGIAMLWSLVAVLAMATAVVAIVLSSNARRPNDPTPVPTTVATTRSTGPTAPRPFPALTAGGEPGTTSSDDPNDLITAATPFIDGVNHHDLGAVVAAACTVLAGRVEQADLDPISDMRVTGRPTVRAGVGRVPISFTDQQRGAQDSELSLVKERGVWKVCTG